MSIPTPSPQPNPTPTARPTPTPPRTRRTRLLPAAAFLALASIASPLAPPSLALENVYLTEVPDYAWHVGCYGTALGNLIGYWDRHGLPDLYTGPTNGGEAPLFSFRNNRGILSLWSSEAGLDGRPENLPGHYDDYYVEYEYAGPDPYESAGRPEHSPDCIGDFIGLNQRKWQDLAGECRGNIDGYAFNFFDREGRRRDNFEPTDPAGIPIPDVQSGLRAFSAFRGYAADTFSQLADFNPDAPGPNGFTFEQLRAEIDAGYPVVLCMQAFGVFTRDFPDAPRVNPLIHAMLAYGYVIDDDGQGYVRYRTSWASGDNQLSPWNDSNWTPDQAIRLPLRGVIGFHPRPRITAIQPKSGGLEIRWHGPRSILRNEAADLETHPHRYVVEQSSNPASATWEQITEPTTDASAVIPECCEGHRFFRVRLLGPSDP